MKSVSRFGLVRERIKSILVLNQRPRKSALTGQAGDISAAMKHLFEDWENIQARIQQAQNLFVFLDYDGTLTPIVSRPELAICPPEIKRVLEKLRDLPKVYLAIISGRSLEDLRGKVGVPGIIYIGNHGLEIEKPGGMQKRLLSSTRIRELNKR